MTFIRHPPALGMPLESHLFLKSTVLPVDSLLFMQ